MPKVRRGLVWGWGFGQREREVKPYGKSGVKVIYFETTNQ